MAMQYLILFSYGENDFGIDIKYKDNQHKHRMNRQYVIMREFYIYKLQHKMYEKKDINKRRKIIPAIYSQILFHMSKKRG